MDVIGGPLLKLLITVVDIYVWMVLFNIILSWLVAFNVINTQNRFVYTVADFLNKITDPALRPIRRFLPNFGGLDISPIVLILALYFLKDVLIKFYMKVM
jgi:YggT family protein